VTPATEPVLDDIEARRAALAAEQLARREAEARAAGAAALVGPLKLTIAQLKHDRFGASSERGRKLLDQLELQLEELEAAAAEDEAALGPDREGVPPRPGIRRKPVRGPLPAHLPRERVVIPGPTECPCCRGKLAKLGEDVTETLEVIPRQWKVIQTVRERLACRACETITQPPAPFRPIARGRAGPELLAMILEAKFGQHLPLSRQSETFAREGVLLDVSTMADWVGACTATLAALIQAHVMAAARIHGDDTTVPVQAKGQTVTGRLRTYVRDDQPFGKPEPPAAMFRHSRDRRGEHPAKHLAGYAGILQVDAYAGLNGLFHEARKPGPMTEAGCWATAGGSSLTSPRRRRPRSRPRRCGGSTPSSTSSAPSTACPQSSASPCARRMWRCWLPASRPGCARHAARCRAMPTWPAPWTACLSAGTRSAGSSATGGSAAAAMPPNARCVAWHSAKSHGGSVDQTAAAIAPRPCARSS